MNDKLRRGEGGRRGRREGGRGGEDERKREKEREREIGVRREVQRDKTWREFRQWTDSIELNDTAGMRKNEEITS